MRTPEQKARRSMRRKASNYKHNKTEGVSGLSQKQVRVLNRVAAVTGISSRALKRRWKDTPHTLRAKVRSGLIKKMAEILDTRSKARGKK